MKKVWVNLFIVPGTGNRGDGEEMTTASIFMEIKVIAWAAKHLQLIVAACVKGEFLSKLTPLDLHWSKR